LSVHAADTIGARALLVHAKDDGARAFYEHFTLEASPSDPYQLLLITKDLMTAKDRDAWVDTADPSFLLRAPQGILVSRGTNSE
jgi:hypothetical protein